MARLSNGILGPIHGKIGTIVGAVWKKTAYVRAMPVAKKDGIHASVAQIACREKFKFVQEWLVPFYPYVTVGFRNYSKDKTEINAAFSKNYRQAILGVHPDLSIAYEKVMMSKGNLPGLYDAVAQLSGLGMLSLTWAPNQNDDSCYDDQLMLIVYNRELKFIDGFIGGSKRTDLQCQFKLNPKLIGKKLDVYLSMVSLNGKKVSNSAYLGRVAPV